MSLEQRDFERAASILGCEVAAVQSVADIESSGDGFLEDGRPRILFEAHIFSRLTEHAFDLSHPDISSRTWNRGLYRSAVREHDRLAEAMSLNRDAALQSASWGMFQLMGFNWKRCGYDTLQAFVDGMNKDEGEHLAAFCRFVQSQGLDDELRRKDWLGFALVYNGPAQADNHYDLKLASAYSAHA